MKQLVLLRHGHVAGNDNQYIGTTNAHLSAKGKEQARQASIGLCSEEFDAIYCSPFDRCRQTLQILDRSEKVLFDERIREINFGLWEGKTFADINEKYSDLVKKWAQCDNDFYFPEGEKLGNFRGRVFNFAQQLYDLEGSKILIVSHGGVIRHLICAFLNISFNNYLYFKVDHCRFVSLNLFSEGGVLTGLNRRCADG